MDDSTTVPRDLIVCCDGTNNTLTGGQQDTNVLQLIEHLRKNPSQRRLLYYDPGVGSPDVVPPSDPIDWASRIWERVSGLASGRGVYDNIAQAYLFLMLNWRDRRDRIYCFGFSRGAFTVRCVVGMVNLFGILRHEHDVLLPTLIRVYFSLPDEREGWVLQRLTRRLHDAAGKEKAGAEIAGAHADDKEQKGSDGAARSRPAKVTEDKRKVIARQIRDCFTSPEGADADVHWVGVWDTVESVGLPGPLSRSNPSTATLRGKRVRNARHALAFDEHRWTFEPRLYEEPDDIASNGQTLKQRWFPGVHCDVGGSYRSEEAGLSEASLEWMFDEVRFDLDSNLPPIRPSDSSPEQEPVRHDAIYETPWWALTGMCLRNMKPMTAPIMATADHPAPGPAARATQLEQTAGSVPGHAVQRVPAAAEAHDLLRPALPIAVIPADATRRPIRTVWADRRPLSWVWIALAVGFVALVFSGACLAPYRWTELWRPEAMLRSVDAAFAFMHDQFFSLRCVLGIYPLSFHCDGLLDPALRATWLGAQPGWAMFWDLLFIGAWGYLLARIASRAFAWLAGIRDEKSGAPGWRWLGMAPLAAVGGDVVEDLLTLAALAMDGIGAGPLRTFFLFLVGVAAAVKWAGLGACLPLLGVRLWIAMPGVPRFRS
ncbi:MAG: DUF2235 domain-containing protein [Caldimonas sp.]